MKRLTDPEWRAKQAAYSSSYASRRKDDGTDFDEKRRQAGRDYYERLTRTEDGRRRVREASLHSYRRKMGDEKLKAGLRKQQREWARLRRKNNPEFAIKGHLRSRLSDLAKSHRCRKDSSALSLTGITLCELRRHIEKQFQRGMSWRNYGEWHIDHIVPCSQFDLTDRRQQAVCFNYLNLRPCWASENIRKGSQILEPSQLPLGI